MTMGFSFGPASFREQRLSFPEVPFFQQEAVAGTEFDLRSGASVLSGADSVSPVFRSSPADELT